MKEKNEKKNGKYTNEKKCSMKKIYKMVVKW